MNTSWQSAWHDSLRSLPEPRRERVARREALGHLLAESITADRDYPAANLSLMDGYAFDASAETACRVEGENRPGGGPGEALRQGTARRIFTGAELPAGAMRVIPQELIERTGDQLRVLEFPATTFVRLRGSEARQGEMILSPGIRLQAVELAILAAVGVSHVEVAARPRVAHLVTGDEIADPDNPAAPPAQIRDANSDLVAAVLHGIGHAIVDHRRVTDDRSQVIAAVKAITGDSEVLLISGGASVGDHDHARAALEAAGFSFITHGVNVRPGKPVGLARRGDQWAVALPGNPISHLVALHLFVLPLLEALEGMKNPEPKLLRGVLAEALTTEIPRRDTFWPSAIAATESGLQIRPRRFLTSGDLIGIAGTRALLFLPANRPIPAPGDAVYFLSLDSRFP